MDLSSFSSSWYSSGGISADLGMPGESMACLPSYSTSLTSSTFFLRPSVPTLVQKVSSLLEESYKDIGLEFDMQNVKMHHLLLESKWLLVMVPALEKAMTSRCCFLTSEGTSLGRGLGLKEQKISDLSSQGHSKLGQVSAFWVE